MDYTETIDEILDHYRNPRNYGELPDATVRAKDSNPLCGDVIEMSLKIEGDRIVDVRFRGKGCAISQASASMLTDRLKGMTLDEARSLNRDYVLGMLGIELSPVRVKCATLSLKVLKLGIYSYLGSSTKDLEV
ncbi:MAG: SUF system NifU family Fe-S cluster assembly protein [Aigarchaeota archaeon]|nr:SUF system NifU family Fe-S cluster assembly protein [Aigarchaeota archaeon]MCS7127429.1 SUF system NifU family Fe-S cluster assembly protein [Candidatus Calditenuaceae archaeon]MCX8203766.1 SUF system NifU family Fe-S cluster assembly protein [Nitrososphaeria archaeon]MDW8042781.1 SUF system NifU family Fe-S cluster assembly protein [Nitrososphaerota archaeon]